MILSSAARNAAGWFRELNRFCVLSDARLDLQRKGFPARQIKKNFLTSLDTQKKLLHNLASLLLTQFSQAADQNTARAAFRGWQGKESRLRVVFKSHRSLTIKQPISVGAWNA